MCVCLCCRDAADARPRCLRAWQPCQELAHVPGVWMLAQCACRASRYLGHVDKDTPEAKASSLYREDCCRLSMHMHLCALFTCTYVWCLLAVESITFFFFICVNVCVLYVCVHVRLHMQFTATKMGKRPAICCPDKLFPCSDVRKGDFCRVR